MNVEIRKLMLNQTDDPLQNTEQLLMRGVVYCCCAADEVH